MPPPVLSAVTSHLRLESEVGGYLAAEEAGERLASVYESIAGLIGAEDVEEIALVEGATVAWTRAFYSIAECTEETNVGEGDVMVCSEMEYAGQ